ncbi:MAG: hypothetical protein ABSG78_13205 [Verrucomicrobiota bacterium]|jgi:hypothetical protein
MADYFTNFSVVLPLPDEAAQRYALDLANEARRAQQGDEPSEKLPDSIQEVIEDWQFETDAESADGKWGLWLHSEYGGIDAVCAFIQHLLQKFDPKGRVALEWSNDCSKPRLDAFGGGAAFITATEIKTMNTSAWLRQQAA